MNRFLLALFLAGCSWASWPSLAISDVMANEASKPAVEIVMYSTRTCGYCAQARAWFSEHELKWDERDIEASAQSHQEWVDYGGVGTPLILINGARFSGFVPTRLEAELAKYR